MGKKEKSEFSSNLCQGLLKDEKKILDINMHLYKDRKL